MGLALMLDTLEGVTDEVKSFYVADADGKFKLDLEGYEDPKGLKSALDKERLAAKEANKLLKDTLKKYEGIDPEQVKTILSRLENDEEAKLLAEGKLDDVVNKRIEKQRIDLERKVTESSTKAELADLRALKFEQQVLKGQLSTAAVSDGVNMHPSAIKYAFIIAQQEGWKLDIDGEARQFDSNGDMVLGKDGKTPFSFVEWLKDQRTREENPTWYTVQNSGGGTGGGSGKSKEIDLSSLAPRDRLRKARELGIK